MPHSLEIKNLAIALEALSRVQIAVSSSYEIERLLNAAIDKQKQLNREAEDLASPPPNHRPVAASRPATPIREDDLFF